MYNHIKKDTPLEEVLSPESVSLIRNLGVWSENLIKDVYNTNETADMDFDPNSRKVWRELYDAIDKMDEGVQKEIVRLLSRGYSIEDICESLEISIEGYRINYKQSLIKLRAMFAAITNPIVISEELRSNDSKNIDYPLVLDVPNAEDIKEIIFGNDVLD